MDPLSTRLSQALVAFTIEFDNESEHRIQHWTTKSGARQGVWLVSMAMWWNCMKYVGDQPVSIKELEHLARTKTNLHGMQRWGYITVDPAPPKLVRATAKGLKAREVWAPLCGMVEKRWEERFGKGEVGRLRDALWVIVSRFQRDLPDCLPILGYGLFSIGPDRERNAPVERELPLAVLLARALLQFAMDFERESDLSLAICANVLRVLDEKGVRVRDLPLASGVSKEALAMAMGILRKKRLAIIVPDPEGSRSKAARLTPKGVAAQDAYLRRLARVEKSWQERFGKPAIAALDNALRPFAGEPLFRGMEPYPDGWRASVRRPDVLPHYPMVLHRGGYPDGS
jgi:DNA-binding MarR family transcriptional regulator